jgi:hypothetical protein
MWFSNPKGLGCKPSGASRPANRSATCEPSWDSMNVARPAIGGDDCPALDITTTC